ncbi:Defensin [Quillaja saponaria]|uniref:Defensin n=1 Tax=Quillaja saponaria TaxID=32244 RepID=A0AAD7LH30_QUISA|nr:Defensin [Quillaja saponaria]
MAKLSYLYPAVVFLFLYLLIASHEIARAEAGICQRRSKTWSGFCGNSGNCDRQCRNWEGATHGACHAQFPGFACFCYFRC